MKYRLYIVTADNCGHCREFKKNQLEKLKTLMNDKPLVDRVETVHVDLQTMSDNKPKEISQYVSWFPTFILKKDNDIFVFNGIIVDGQVKYNEGKHENSLGAMVDNIKSPTADNIYLWVSEKISFSNNP